jgi:hypothetical protein
MKSLKTLYHFLGSIYFALILIATAAFLVILGTLIEAQTDSHLLAAQWTYSHPFFNLLLGLFFINILVSALRRWPFKVKHIPFLITHLGLLMILSGTILKNFFGLQGSMDLIEGSASQSVYIPHSFALHIEKQEGEQLTAARFPLSMQRTLIDLSPFSSLQLKVLQTFPHSKEHLETWIKGNYAFIFGSLPIPVQEWKPGSAIQTHQQPDLLSWQLAAVRTPHIEEALKHFYIQNTEVIAASEVISLADALQNQNPLFHLQLDLSFSPIEGLQNPRLKVDWMKKETIEIPLAGSHALQPILTTPSYSYTPAVSIQLNGKPTLLILQDDQEDNYLCALSSQGQMHLIPFRQDSLQNLLVYNQGFEGYGVQAVFPFGLEKTNTEDKKQQQLIASLKQLLKEDPPLAPPLELLSQACQKTGSDLAETFVRFLYAWHQSHLFLLSPDAHLSPSLSLVLDHLEWNDRWQSEFKACQWISLLFMPLAEAIENGESALSFLKNHRWPFLDQLNAPDPSPQLLTALAQQVFALSSSLPSIDHVDLSPSEKGHLLSAFFKAYGLEYQTLASSEPIEESKTVWETPLTTKHQLAIPFTKLENNKPLLVLEAQEGSSKQRFTLAYDPSGTGLKWPLWGLYTFRFQPRQIDIPYRIRLREARQINYAHSNQPYSYESDIVIIDKEGKEEEATLSMNHVHETWDGYRFYLAGMSPARENGIKRIHVVVNHDPAKYLLTYPGALLVALGAILLFWMKPYAKKR